jgi:NADH-quinone oxidoreductase E subunit
MARLSSDNVRRARELMGLYPEPRSALIPMLHVLQEQDGWLTPDGMEHVGELLDLTAAEVYGTASFYDMLFTHKVGRYLVSVCTNLACLLNGGYELLEHAERRLAVASGDTTADGEFTVEEVECIALCGEAPCLAVNWRFFGNVGPPEFDRLVDDLRTGRLADTVPPHGTLCRVRRKVAAGGPGDHQPGDDQPIAPPVDEGAAPSDEPAIADMGAQGEEQPSHPRSTASAASQARAIRVAGEGVSDRAGQQEDSEPVDGEPGDGEPADAEHDDEEGTR